MRRQPRILCTAVVALCAGALLLGLAGGASAVIPLSARYDVQIQGTVNGIPFGPRAGSLLVAPTVTLATTNGVNAVELCLRSGSPFITPEPGALWLGTNAACINPNGARQDMAFVAADAAASTVALRPDAAISATGVNGFNQSSGLTAAVWQIFDGSALVRFLGNGETIAGTLDLLGTGAIFHSENRYIATLTGQARELVVAPPVVQPPAGDEEAAAPRAPGIRRLRGQRRVSRRRVARIATLVCRTGPCAVSVPRTVPLALGGKHFRAAVLAPDTLASDERGAVRIKLSRAVFRDLAGRHPRVRVKIGLSAAGELVTRTAKVTLTRPG